jgi:hypothetical protein
MNKQKRIDVFEKAELVMYDQTRDYFLVWYGGQSNTINVFDGETLECVTCWTTYGENSATTGKLEPYEVKHSMLRRMQEGDYP